MVIVFTHDAEPVSDYEVEEFYHTFKNSKEIHICNLNVLSRFRLGVISGEIDNFTIRVKREDGNDVDVINNRTYSDIDILGDLLDKFLDKILKGGK